MIAYFLGEAAVGQYVAGYGVADKTVLLICSWATMAASPLLLAAYEKGGREAAEREAAHLARTLLLLAMPAAAGLALVARPLGEIMVGEALREQATRIMPWIAFAGLLNGFLVQYIGEAFNIIKRTADRALLMLVPVCVNVILNLILLPRIGLMGAVYATLIAYAAGIIVLGLAVRRHLRLPVPLNDLVRISLATLAMAGAVSLLPDLGGWPELMLKGLTGAGVYAMAVYALNAGGARDLIATRGRIQNTE
jgi:O-antigen/teichoic acid export membrane protein